MALDLFLEPSASTLPAHARPGHGGVSHGARPAIVPQALLHNLKHNKVLHERTVFLWVETVDVPHVPTTERVVVDHLAIGFWRLTLRAASRTRPTCRWA